MKTYKFTQTKEIANALNNVSKPSSGDFIVDFTGNDYGVGDFAVKCFHDRNDDSIAISTIGWVGATWFSNTTEGRAKAFKHLT